HETGLLRYVDQHAPAVPVVEIVAADYPSQNVLGQPYSIQKKIVRFGLLSSETSFIDLTQKRQCAFADQFGTALKDLFAVRSGIPGLVEAASVIDHVRGSGDASSFCIQPFDVSVHPSSQDPSPDESSRTASSHNMKPPPYKNETEVDYMDNSSAMKTQMHGTGFLVNDEGQEKYVLAHQDLNMSPHNIMVNIEYDEDERHANGVLRSADQRERKGSLSEQ
ncbi:MAG: hypothetical protein Q9164_007676, partial [Protoblastenia rupestris]